MRAADDFDVIRQRITVLRFQNEGRCAIREGKSSSDCWCYKAGPDGNSLPCPPPPNTDALSESPIGYQIISITNLPPGPGGDIMATFFQPARVYEQNSVGAAKIRRELYKEYME